MKTKLFTLFMLFIAAAIFSTASFAEDKLLKPYVLAYQGEGTIDARLAETKAALEKEGFQVAGEYSPYKGLHIVVVTSDELRAKAGQSDFGAFGAVQRVALTETGKELQISYTNPLYMAQAYRMKDDLAGIAAKLEAALGKKAAFGSKDGLTAAKLRKYHYMMLMPYFDDRVTLATHDSFDAAVKAVEDGLAKGLGGTTKVYRIDIPGKKEAVFGVGIKEGDGADATVMKTVDFGELKQTPHLPYELVVSDKGVYCLHGKFRIAVDFPDLTMGTFMKISGAPSGIEASLKAAAGGK